MKTSIVALFLFSTLCIADDQFTSVAAKSAERNYSGGVAKLQQVYLRELASAQRAVLAKGDLEEANRIENEKKRIQKLVENGNGDDRDGTIGTYRHGDSPLVVTLLPQGRCVWNDQQRTVDGTWSMRPNELTILYNNGNQEIWKWNPKDNHWYWNSTRLNRVGE